MEHNPVKKKEPKAKAAATEKAVDAPPPKKKSEIQLSELYLKEKYLFRFNEIKCKAEYRFTLDEAWKPMDKYKLNSMKRELDAYGIRISVDSIKQIIESDFCVRINPVKEYFRNLRPWNELTDPDYIKQLTDTVTCKNPDHWYKFFKKWIVAVVGNVFIDEKCANHTCLVLTGDQGKYKSTWLNNLCPPSIGGYIYIGKIDPNSKDSLSKIADYLYINIDDQLRQINKKDENDLKSLITVDYLRFRRPFDPFDTEYPHLASFMGSVNGNDFLTDPTGSRRFLPFEVTNIDINAAKKIDLDLVYAQAYALFKSGFMYWFPQDEINELTLNNANFQVITTEEQLLLQYYDIPVSRADATHNLQVAMIHSNIELWSKLKINSKKLGEALTKHNFHKWQKTENKITKWVYSVIEKDKQAIISGDEQSPTIEYSSFTLKELMVKLTDAKACEDYTTCNKLKIAIDLKKLTEVDPEQTTMSLEEDRKDDLPF